MALVALGAVLLAFPAPTRGQATHEIATNEAERRVLRLPRATEFRLANGLSVVLQEAHFQPQVALLVAYEIGWRDDPVGYASLAHLVEHLTYRGSRHLAPLWGTDWLERLGATAQNGLTHPDYTAYYALLPARALAHALWIESERMAFTLERFDERHLELERAIVRNEHRMRDPPLVLLDWGVEQAIFGESHPYVRKDASAGDLDAIDLSDVRWFFQQAYRPSNAKLILVGHFDPHRARELVERYFGSIRNPPGKVMRRSTAARPFAKNRLVTLEAHLFVERLLVAWPATSNTQSAHAAASVFGRLMRQRIKREVVDRMGLGSSASMGFDQRDLGSRFEVAVALRPGVEHEDVERALARVFEAAAADISDEELAVTKKSAMLDEFFELEDLVGRAFDHLNSLRSAGRAFAVSERIAALRALTSADLRRLARSYAVGPKVVARVERAPRRSNVPVGGRIEVEE